MGQSGLSPYIYEQSIFKTLIVFETISDSSFVIRNNNFIEP